jgi:threonine/homoserine/homoserine lactone efflux protein
MAAVLLMQAVPAPDTVLVAARGMGQGLRIALATVFGMTMLAGLIQLPMLAFGLGEIARSHPAIFDAIRLVSAAYLVWLGRRRSGAGGAVTTQLKATGFGLLALVALASGRVGDRLASRPDIAHWQARISGAILVAIGVWLLIAR